MKRRYRVRTYDATIGEYTPQDGMKMTGLTLWGVRRALRALRCMGYSAHRVGNSRDGHDSDPSILVEREASR